MNYRIIEKEPFRLVGYQKRVPIIFSGVNPEITNKNDYINLRVLANK